jgi:hypothetical protein
MAITVTNSPVTKTVTTSPVTLTTRTTRGRPSWTAAIISKSIVAATSIAVVVNRWDHVLCMRYAHRDPVMKHRLLERDERQPRQHKALILLHQVIRFLDQHVDILGEDGEIVRPAYHPEQPQVLTLRRRSANALNPRVGAEHRLSR